MERRDQCGVHVDGVRLEHVSEFKYFWDVFWMNQVQMEQNAVGRWQVGGGGLQVPSGP